LQMLEEKAMHAGLTKVRLGNRVFMWTQEGLNLARTVVE